MKRKIVGILVAILLSTSTVLPVTGIIDIYREHENAHNSYNSDFHSSNKYAWSGEGHGLDNEGIISVVVSSYFPVYLSFSTSYEIFSPDMGMVELSTDGGYNWYPMDSITGVQMDWTIRSVDISSFAGLPVLIRFRYTTGSYSTSGGWYVDTISVKDDVVEDFEGYNDGDYWGDWVIIEETGDLPPTVGVTFPSSGDTVTGTIVITGEAHDPNGDETLDWVMVNIDNSGWEYADGTSSWSYVWDTTTVNDGSHIISAIASDGFFQSPVASVSVIVDNGVGPGDQPDLVITDVWDENDLIYYQIRNIGDDNASGEHLTELYVDYENKAGDLVDMVLAPGERFTSNFDYDWDCAELEVYIWAIADNKDVIDESNETNNKREELWKCDTTAPEIIYGPVVQNVAQNSATINWKTNEDCDSTVRFDSYAGEYNNDVGDSELVKVHNVELTGLNPSTVYHYMVESMDATGNQVKSRDYYFATSQVSDNVKPSLFPFIPDVLSGIVDISVDVSDNVGVDLVHFSCDDDPIFTDYSPPYEFGFYTGGLLDGEHDFGFDAVDEAGNSASESLRGEIMNKFPPDLEPPLNVHIVHPVDEGEYVIGDQIHIIALIESEIDTCLEQYEIILDDSIPLCSEVFECPPWIEVTIPGLLEHYNGGIFEHYIGEGKFWWIHYWWNTTDYRPFGTSKIRVSAWDNHNNNATDWVEFNLNIPPPDVQVFREVRRRGNYYSVLLRIRNNGVLPIYDFNIYDTSVGFQCVPSSILPSDVTIIGGAESYNDGQNIFSRGDFSEIQIRYPGYIRLEQNEELQLSYYVIPVLYDSTNSVVIEGLEWDSGTIAVPHVIGHKLLIEFNSLKKKHSLQRDDLRVDLTSNLEHRCVDDVSCAFSDADYLIITSPARLCSENPDSLDEVNNLLVSMAELARLKNGVLGYTLKRSASGVKGNIKAYDGDWFVKLCPPLDDGRGPFNYLLLVGENEIIPSPRSSRTFDPFGDDVHVDLIDIPYANIKPNGKPDISVGRIIGNTTSALIEPIQNSIKVHENEHGYDFDRDKVMLISGTGEGVSSFQRSVNDIYDIITSDPTYGEVNKVHWRNYPGTELDTFNYYSPNTDIVVFRDHGNYDSWQPGMSTNSANGLDFGSSKPFIFALACRTGDYENNDDYNIAEAFFESGAAVYIGSTEDSSRSENNAAGKWFFRNWDEHESLGKNLKDLKRHYYGEDDMWKYWCYEYNLYGDPKYGATEAVALEDNTDDSAIIKMDLGEPSSSINVIVPDYVVTTYEGLDYVEIPNGEIFSVEDGRPEVPYYNIYIEYPIGYRVQDVMLDERYGLMTDIGLELPIVVLNEFNGSIEETKGEWYPEIDYTWRIEKNDDRSTTLIISMYPFYYNPDTTMVKFYKNYDFEIEYVSTDMTITALYTDKYIYKPGDKVVIDLWFENLGEQEDFIANLVIKHDVTEEVVDGLFLRSLKDLNGLGSYSITWNSHDTLSDSYNIEAIITDTSGNILDTETDMIYLETPSSLEIESISGGFGVTAVVENTGIENLTDLKWSISIEGNITFIGGYKEGNIDLLKPGDGFTIKSGFMLGFGPAEIVVNVAGVSKKASCFVIGPFVLDVQEK